MNRPEIETPSKINWFGIYLFMGLLTAQSTLIPPQVGYAKLPAQCTANISLARPSPDWMGEDGSLF